MHLKVVLFSSLVLLIDSFLFFLQFLVNYFLFCHRIVNSAYIFNSELQLIVQTILHHAPIEVIEICFVSQVWLVALKEECFAYSDHLVMRVLRYVQISSLFLCVRQFSINLIIFPCSLDALHSRHLAQIDRLVILTCISFSFLPVFLLLNDVHGDNLATFVFFFFDASRHVELVVKVCSSVLHLRIEHIVVVIKFLQIRKRHLTDITLQVFQVSFVCVALLIPANVSTDHIICHLLLILFHFLIDGGY